MGETEDAPILAMLGPKAAEYRLTGEPSPRMGSRCNIQAPRDVYRTSDDRYVALSTGTQAMAERGTRSFTNTTPRRHAPSALCRT